MKIDFDDKKVYHMWIGHNSKWFDDIEKAKYWADWLLKMGNKSCFVRDINRNIIYNPNG